MNAIAHGIDLVDIARIERMLADHGDRFLQRVFTPLEQQYAQAGGMRGAERLAARFAAKEAVLKALGTGLRSGMSWTEIEVGILPSGAPTLVTTGCVDAVARERTIASWLISLSHSGGFAVASVIGVSSPTL